MKNKSLQYVKALLPPDKVKSYEPEEKLLYCEDCKRVYEVFFVNGKMKEAHFKDMCSLHLQRKQCMKCRNKK